jgi:hypothetical protein
VPRAVKLWFADLKPDQGRFEHPCSPVVVIDRRLSPEHRSAAIQGLRDPEAVDVDDLTPTVLREIIDTNVATATENELARACDTIRVAAAEFNDLPPPTLPNPRYSNRIYLDGPEAGFFLRIGDGTWPHGFHIEIHAHRGLYGVENMPGTKRLQAQIEKILETMSNFEVDQPFEPIPPDHWSLRYYN